MKKEFKEGDLVFIVDTSNSVRLGEFIRPHGSRYSLIEDYKEGESYFGYGFEATPENHKALGVLYGEGMVPALPLQGSELTKVLLKKWKYVLCYCCETSDDDCRKNKNLRVVTCFEDGYFYSGKVNSPFTDTCKYAIPIDNNGNELTEAVL